MVLPAGDCRWLQLGTLAAGRTPASSSSLIRQPRQSRCTRRGRTEPRPGRTRPAGIQKSADSSRRRLPRWPATRVGHRHPTPRVACSLVATPRQVSVPRLSLIRNASPASKDTCEAKAAALCISPCNRVEGVLPAQTVVPTRSRISLTSARAARSCTSQ